MKFASAFACLPVAAATLFLAGCASQNYQPIHAELAAPASSRSASTAVVFLEPVAGKPFDEVVSDNVVGTTWSPAESSQIGFTQNYSETLAKHGPQLALLAAAPAAVGTGLAASGQSGFNISSRIMVPYGRFITANLGALITSSAPHAALCLDQQCVGAKLQADPARRLVTVRFSKLSVAENVPNTLTLVVEGTASFEQDGKLRSVPVRQSIVDRSITSEGMWHSAYLRVMNKMANEITSSVGQQIFAAATDGQAPAA